ncbi:Hsp70 family protein [Hoyosella subflava]|nr:Hsp70 family protein [Hoyosella subflava]
MAFLLQSGGMVAATLGIALGEANVRWALRTSDGGVEYGSLPAAGLSNEQVRQFIAGIERQHRLALADEGRLRIAEPAPHGLLSELESAGYRPMLLPGGSAAWAGLAASVDLPPEGYILVCDIGAAAISYSFVDAASGDVVNRVVDRAAGGDAFDEAIAAHIRDTSFGVTRDMHSQAVEIARELKDSLSRGSPASAIIAEQPISLTAERLAEILTPIIAASFAGAARTVAESDVAVAAVAVVGAGAQLPFVTGLAGEWFRVPVFRPTDPAYAVVLGLLSETPFGGTAVGARHRRFPAWTVALAVGVSLTAAVGLGLVLASEVNSQWDSIIRDRQGAVTVPQRDPYPSQSDVNRTPRTEWMAPIPTLAPTRTSDTVGTTPPHSPTTTSALSTAEPSVTSAEPTSPQSTPPDSTAPTAVAPDPTRTREPTTVVPTTRPPAADTPPVTAPLVPDPTSIGSPSPPDAEPDPDPDPPSGAAADEPNSVEDY